MNKKYLIGVIAVVLICIMAMVYDHSVAKNKENAEVATTSSAVTEVAVTTESVVTESATTTATVTPDAVTTETAVAK